VRHERHTRSPVGTVKKRVVRKRIRAGRIEPAAGVPDRLIKERMMAAITASMVAELRAKTDAPMMECKKALTEADGDMARAEELLRVKLGNKASKAASRVTAEGVIASYIGGSVGAVVELNCETDFVAKNDDFNAFAKQIAELVATQNPADVAALSALPFEGSTVDAVRLALVGKIGENLSIRRFARFETVNKLATYLHGTRIGVLVEYAGAEEQVGRDVAMHIAAMKPVSLSSDDVPADLIAKERSIAEQKAAESGKPAEIVAKMVEGSVQKYLKEVSLLNQPFVKNDKQTIEQMLKAAGTSVQRFALFVVGEGIEKRQDDFAAEVAAQVAAAKQQ
jgi:elongation factor Ts